MWISSDWNKAIQPQTIHHYSCLCVGSSMKCARSAGSANKLETRFLLSASLCLRRRCCWGLICANACDLRAIDEIKISWALNSTCSKLIFYFGEKSRWFFFVIILKNSIRRSDETAIFFVQCREETFSKFHSRRKGFVSKCSFCAICTTKNSRLRWNSTHENIFELYKIRNVKLKSHAEEWIMPVVYC